MNQLITPELRDQILNYLIAKAPLGDVEDFDSESNPIPKPEGLSYSALIAILENFRENRFIELSGFGFDDRSYMAGISVTIKAIDHQRLGGFVGQEVLFKQNVEKLLLELKNLKPSSTEQADKITSIVANISTFLGFLMV